MNGNATPDAPSPLRGPSEKSRISMPDERLHLWEQFKRDHPPGSWVTGVVKSRHPFGMYFELGIPFMAYMDRLYMARPEGRPLPFPEGFPAVGDWIDVKILRYSQPGPFRPDVHIICLTQSPMSMRELTGWRGIFAVLAAYGWDDLDPKIGHHPTKIGIRWTVSPEARFELLDRLLVENHRRAEQQ